jgi:predicted MPP superfamily phosphohydrolase
MRLGTRPAGSGLTRRTFLKSATASVLGATALGAGGLGYSREIEPEWVEIADVPLTLPRLAVEFDGYRIAHLTDIHLDRETAPEYTAEVLRLTNAQRPDLVAITGDFVTHDPERFAPPLAGLLRGLEARDGVVAVLGNHDHWTDAAAVRRVIEDGGAVLLDNAVRTLRRGSAALHVAGLDDWWSGEPDLDAVLRLLPADGAAVLLVHEPDAADAVAAEQRFDLQLSGHSHGGQVRLPLVGPLRLPPYGRRYPAGLYRVEGMRLYTSRGVGVVAPRVRFNCRPEIAVVSLHRDA